MGLNCTNPGGCRFPKGGMCLASCSFTSGPATTATTAPARAFTLEDLKRLERELELMPKPQWALIAPDGKTWMDADPQVLLRVLAGAVAANWTHDVSVAPAQTFSAQTPTDPKP